MRPWCSCIRSGSSLLVALAASFALAAPAFGGACANGAGAGDTPEGEACALDNNDDQFNGGCNSDPPIYSEVDPGNVICGTTSNFDFPRTCILCTIDDDCNAGETCVSGECRDSCVDASDCPLGGACVSGVCDSACPSDGDCIVDFDGDLVPDHCSGTKEIRRRDTDWHRITYAELNTADSDNNGVVQVRATLLGELGTNLVTFVIGLGGIGEECVNGSGASSVTFPGETGYYNGLPGSNDVTCQGEPAGTFEPAVAVLVIDEYPNGIVVFTATGECDGSVIVDGNECSTGLNDYNLAITVTNPPYACTVEGAGGGQPCPPTCPTGFLCVAGTCQFPSPCGPPACPPGYLCNQDLDVCEYALGPCNEANPTVKGCEDPECCKLVCLPAAQGGFNPLCCAQGWLQGCANAAIDLGCAPELGSPVCMATGADNTVEGYLKVCADPYGALSSDGFCGNACIGTDPFTDPEWGDEYNPAGFDLFEATFSSGFMLFDRPNQLRELLANILAWTNAFLTPDVTLSRAIVGIGNLEFDENPVDGITDKLTSEFNVGGALSLNFVVEQTVSNLSGAISVLEQTYTITNTGGSPAEFVMLRLYDGDFYWPDVSDLGLEQIDDNVGTGTNGNPSLDRYVYQDEDGEPATAVTISSAVGTIYYGSKQGVDPDGPGGVDAMGFGTDTQQWDEYGVPPAWENFIAGIGADTDGNSGPTPAGGIPNHDASIGLAIPVSLSAAGPGSAVTFVVHHTYGATTPLGGGQPACEWDCDGSADGNVNVGDLLALLGAYDPQAPAICDGGACDYNGNGCVDVVDLLKLLAHYTPDPGGIGCP